MNVNENVSDASKYIFQSIISSHCTKFGFKDIDLVIEKHFVSKQTVVNHLDHIY